LIFRRPTCPHPASLPPPHWPLLQWRILVFHTTPSPPIQKKTTVFYILKHREHNNYNTTFKDDGEGSRWNIFNQGPSSNYYMDINCLTNSIKCLGTQITVYIKWGGSIRQLCSEIVYRLIINLLL
jgi:hypothetical protein